MNAEDDVIRWVAIDHALGVDLAHWDATIASMRCIWRRTYAEHLRGNDLADRLTQSFGASIAAMNPTEQSAGLAKIEHRLAVRTIEELSSISAAPGLSKAA